MPSFSRAVLAFVVLSASVAARADEPLADPEVGASVNASGLEAEAVDVHDGIAFTGRAIGVPALILGGGLLGAGLHAIVVSDALGRSGLGTAAYWTDLGGLIAVAVSALPLIAGEVGLGAGALGDGLTALDLTAAEAEGSGMAWTRLGLWELAGQGFALGAGLTLGGVLSLITSLVLPSVLLFDAAGVAAYDDLFALSLTTTVFGVVTLVVAAVLGGVSVWLGGAVTSSYKRAARGETAELALPDADRVASSASAIAY